MCSSATGNPPRLLNLENLIEKPLDFLKTRSKPCDAKPGSQGNCLKGEHCEFSHHWPTQPNNICTFFQKGMCYNGSCCQYDHFTAPPVQPFISESSSSCPRNLIYMYTDTPLSPSSSFPSSSACSFQLSDSNLIISPPLKSDSVGSIRNENDAYVNIISSDVPLCSFATTGSCTRGDSCPQVHGDLCSICEKYCLHPFCLAEKEEHIKLCLKNMKHLEALKHSQEIECSVCFDRVLSKPTTAERKFGLLSECDHPFCISCIRNWRKTSSDSAMDVRLCPVCRKHSYFVIPSVIWHSSKEEKQEIVDNYKAKLRSIDCHHFDFGDGLCPFGASCFYKHAYPDGRLEQVALQPIGIEDDITHMITSFL